MKICIGCGRNLPDAANFCPGCGTQQSAVGPERDKWGVPKPAQTQQQQTPQTPDRWGDVGAAPIYEPVPEAKKKGGLKWWHIVLPLLVIALAVGGVFVWRVLQHPTEWKYYEDGEFLGADLFDKKGHLIGYEEATGYEEAYRITDACEDIDVSEVEDADGVKTVECRQIFTRADSDDELEETDTFLVLGYDWRGNVVTSAIMIDLDDEVIIYRRGETEYDLFGGRLHTEQYTSDGSLLTEREYENEYSFGQLERSEAELTNYGHQEYDFDEEVFVFVPNDEPLTFDQTIKYRY